MFETMSIKIARFPRRFLDNVRGSLAIEFAAVMMPFISLLFGTVAVGLYFFVTFSLENAIEQVARQIRTGQAQTAQKTMSTFKSEVCSKAPSFINCDEHLRVRVQQFTDFASITPPSCIDSTTNEIIADPDGKALVPGDSQSIVLALVCYEWTLAGSLPFMKLGNMNNGSAMIQAAAVFKTEPYK